jgi:hypothetical protein
MTMATMVIVMMTANDDHYDHTYTYNTYTYNYAYNTYTYTYNISTSMSSTTDSKRTGSNRGGGSGGGGGGGDTSKKVVIFDTNAYRVLTHGLPLDAARAKVLQLRQLEGHSGNSALAHPIVVSELLTHLVDASDPAYGHCVNALVALGEHTTSGEMQNGGICLIADALSTVCRELFGRLPSGYQQGLEKLGSVVTYIVKHAPNLTDAVTRQNIENLGRGMETEEEGWLKGMEGILDQFSPGTAKVVFGGGSDKEVLRRVRAYFASPAFFEAWSGYIVVSNAAEVGIALTRDEIRAKAEVVRNLFPVPFRLMSTLLQKLATPQPPDLANPKRKRWNFIWDSMISFSIGPGTIDDAPVYMVTGDGDIIEAAKASGFQNQMLTLDDYLKSVGMT